MLEVKQALLLILSKLIKQLTTHLRYFKNKFRKEAEVHTSCLELCLSSAVGNCSKGHPHTSPEIDSFYLHVTVLAIEEGIQDLPSANQATLSKQLDESLTNFKLYLGHLLRSKHQTSYYQFVVSNLKPEELVVIVDYKMKLELGKYSIETQRQFYGKRGLSLHGFYVIAKTIDGDHESGVMDLWCEDTKQDSWFTQSALDIGFHWLEDKYPAYSVYLFSDNAPHYYNTGVLVCLAGVSLAFNVQLELKNVKCQCKLVIGRTKAPKKVGSLKDISTFGSFEFPVTGDYSGGLVCRSLAGLGKTVCKTKVQIEALSSCCVRGSRKVLISNDTLKCEVA